jgi:hypothetical protein
MHPGAFHWRMNMSYEGESGHGEGLVDAGCHNWKLLLAMLFKASMGAGFLVGAVGESKHEDEACSQHLTGNGEVALFIVSMLITFTLTVKKRIPSANTGIFAGRNEDASEEKMGALHSGLKVAAHASAVGVAMSGTSMLLLCITRMTGEEMSDNAYYAAWGCVLLSNYIFAISKLHLPYRLDHIKEAMKAMQGQSNSCRMFGKKEVATATLLAVGIAQQGASLWFYQRLALSLLFHGGDAGNNGKGVVVNTLTILFIVANTIAYVATQTQKTRSLIEKGHNVLFPPREDEARRMPILPDECKNVSGMMFSIVGLVAMGLEIWPAVTKLWPNVFGACSFEEMRGYQQMVAVVCAGGLGITSLAFDYMQLPTAGIIPSGEEDGSGERNHLLADGGDTAPGSFLSASPV